MTSEQNKRRLGGYTETLYATPDIQEMAEQVRKEIEGLFTTQFQVYNVVYYRTQLVAGMNYLMKIQVDNNQYIHVRIFKPLAVYKHPLQLTKVSRAELEDELN